METTIHFIDFESFDAHGSFPRCGTSDAFVHPLTSLGNANLQKQRSDFNELTTLFIYVCHRWLDPTHPDNKEGDMHKLVVSAVHQLIASRPMYEENFRAALWVDFCCLDQDAPSPARELQEMHKIIMWCDILLLPIHDPKHSKWALPAGGLTQAGAYEEYQAKQFQELFKRAWPLTELLASHVIPVPEGTQRAPLFTPGRLNAALSTNRRMLILYGTKEMKDKAPHHVLPPVLNKELVTWDPRPLPLGNPLSDKAAIEGLMKQLEPYVTPLRVGFTGMKLRSGVLNGTGFESCKNGDTFEGRWREGSMYGFATHRFANGDCFEGEFVDHKKCGKGIYKYANGDILEGEFANNRPHGKCKFTYVHGDLYDGEYVNGKWEGNGTLWFANGNVYTGEYKRGKQHGKGKYTWTSGNVYEGEWVEGKREGRGVQTFANGNVYDGEWADNKHEGQGKYTFADSANVYEGGWKGGKMEGTGTLVYFKKGKYEGEWKGGKRDGQGKFSYDDGRVEEGVWRDDKRAEV